MPAKPARKPVPKGRRNQKRNYTLRAGQTPDGHRLLRYTTTMNIGGEKATVTSVDRRKPVFSVDSNAPVGMTVASGTAKHLYGKGKGPKGRTEKRKKKFRHPNKKHLWKDDIWAH